MEFAKLLDYSQDFLKERRVLIRSDMNAPHDDHGRINDDFRIRSALPAIEYALSAGARVLVTSHLNKRDSFGRREEQSLVHIGKRLSLLLEKEVPLVSSWFSEKINVQPGEIVLLENCRFNQGEEENSLDLAQKISAMCDVYVNDAFGVSHRCHTTVDGITRFVDEVCAGPLLEMEFSSLNRVLEHAGRPKVLIIGGNDVHGKLSVLTELIEKIDVFIVGGALANTFLSALGKPIGSSVASPEQIDIAKAISKSITARGSILLTPFDVVCSKSPDGSGSARIKLITDIESDEFILDIGPDSALEMAKHLKSADTVFWIGPVGAYEAENFSRGTRVLAHALAQSKAYSIAGGGETTSAIDLYKVRNHINYISTGGTALLHMIAGKELPALTALKRRGVKRNIAV